MTWADDLKEAEKKLEQYQEQYNNSNRIKQYFMKEQLKQLKREVEYCYLMEGGESLMEHYKDNPEIVRDVASTMAGIHK